MGAAIAVAMLSLLSFVVATASAEPTTDGPGPLVTADWLSRNLCAPGLVVVDLRASHVDYRAGHVPCAVHSSFRDGGWRVRAGAVPMMMPPVAGLEALIGGLGIGHDSRVVLYTAGSGDIAAAEVARAYLTLWQAGLSRISILDGGFAAYIADWRNDVETGDREPEPVAFRASPREDVVVGVAAVEAALAAGTPVVDLRAPDYHLGINREAVTARPGTLPGALNLPLTWLTVNRGLAFRSGDDLRALFAAAGVPTAGRVLFFCNSGLESALGWFAAHALLGNAEAVIYDGSLAEWSADPGRPMAVKVPLPSRDAGP